MLLKKTPSHEKTTEELPSSFQNNPWKLIKTDMDSKGEHTVMERFPLVF